MTVLIIAEHDNNNLKAATAHAITAADELGEKHDLLIMGSECETVVIEAQKYSSVARVILVTNNRFDNPVAEDMSIVVSQQAKGNYSHILAPATTFGKNLLPRVAAMLDVACYSDVIRFESSDTFVRPIYAGNVLQTVEALDDIKVLSVRTTAFSLKEQDSNYKAELIQQQAKLEKPLAECVSKSLSESSRPELTDARVVVSGGRGLQNKDNFALVEELADCLGAAVGASRAAVDAGFVANDYQVGQTGKVVAPELYIALGISGAVQHLAGMKDSKVIVAINKDEEAPIFQLATYGLVGDLFKLVPELISKLKG
jgi:electron transfer flavoprotein alpha subunit